MCECDLVYAPSPSTERLTAAEASVAQRCHTLATIRTCNNSIPAVRSAPRVRPILPDRSRTWRVRGKGGWGCEEGRGWGGGRGVVEKGQGA